MRFGKYIFTFSFSFYFSVGLASTISKYFMDASLTSVRKNVLSQNKLERVSVNASPLPSKYLSNVFVRKKNTDIEKIDNLVLLGRIWGFLKYFDPCIAGGNLDWDAELVKFLPSYLTVSSLQNRNQLLTNWINGFGKVEKCLKCNDSILQSVQEKPDLLWITQEEILGKSLSSCLATILANHYLGKQKYIGVKNSPGIPVITNELTYPDSRFPGEVIRLICAFRYWNLIEYWYPYKKTLSIDWDSQLRKFIEMMLNCKSESDYVLGVKMMVASIQDSHAYAYTQSIEIEDSLYGRYYYPAKVEMVIDTAVVSNAYENNKSGLGLQPGDIIKSVNGITVKDFIAKEMPFTSGSTLAGRLSTIGSKLLRSNMPVLDLNIIRDGIEFTITLALEKGRSMKQNYPDFSYQQDSVFFMIQNDIGYLNLGKIRKEQIKRIFSGAKIPKGLIIDCRLYPFSFPIEEICYYLIPDERPFVQVRLAKLDYPGAFSCEKYGWMLGGGKESCYKGKVIVLVNSSTISSGEFHVMAFRQSANVIVVGTNTAGADGDAITFYLPGNIRTAFSGVGILTLDGRETQRIGLIPDIIKDRTVRGIKEQRDELLEKAIEILKTK